MEKAKCLLCGNDAKKGVYSATKGGSGVKYDCPECGLYALSDSDYHWIEIFTKKEQKETLSEYVKENPDKNGFFKEFKQGDIKKILRLSQKI